MEPSAVPISAVEHYTYCPRQCALIHGDGVWADNEHTIRGGRGHQRVDSGATRIERGGRVLRAIPLWSETLGLTGRADAVQLDPEGPAIVPIEYKIGVPHGDAAAQQVCAQALCLEEMLGVTIPRAAVYYSAPRRRTILTLDADLRAKTLATIEAIRDTLDTGVLPMAANDERCVQCQLADHCLPGLVANPSAIDVYCAEVLDPCGI